VRYCSTAGDPVRLAQQHHADTATSVRIYGFTMILVDRRPSANGYDRRIIAADRAQPEHPGASEVLEQVCRAVAVSAQLWRLAHTRTQHGNSSGRQRTGKYAAELCG
jgi:hypothetical protein